MSNMQFAKAVRKKVRLKMLIDGASGSGKTIGALHAACGLAGANERVAVIDSERDRSEYYADRYDFDKLSLEKLDCQSYIAAINAAISAGYRVIVIDSLSHAWLHLLDRKDEFDRKNPDSNRWTNWGRFTPEWDKLIRLILDCDAHVICTSRSKQAHEQIEENGKKKVVKLGLQPQIREGSEYEFALTVSLNEAHNGRATKDNTFLFGDDTKGINLLSDEFVASIKDWLSNGADAKPKPAQPSTASGKPTVATIRNAVADAKFDDGPSVGQWVGRIAARIPELTGLAPEKVDLVEHIRQEVGVSDLATGAEIWQGWTQEQVATSKLAILYWLDNVKSVAA